YPGANAYGVSVTGPGCPPTVAVRPGDTPGTLQTPCGGIEIASAAPQASNADRQILIRMGTTSQSPTTPGDWSLRLTGDVVAGGNAPFSIIGADNGGELAFTSHSSPNITEILTNPVSARRVIGVAAYTTRYAWNSMSGPFTRDAAFGPLNDVGNF